MKRAGLHASTSGEGSRISQDCGGSGTAAAAGPAQELGWRGLAGALVLLSVLVMSPQPSGGRGRGVWRDICAW